MTNEAEINRDHSLGRLRPAQKTKPRSPDCTGKLHLKRDHLLIFLKQLEQSQVDEVTCNIAGWKGHGAYGPFMTIEISPRFEKRLASHNSDPFSESWMKGVLMASRFGGLNHVTVAILNIESAAVSTSAFGKNRKSFARSEYYRL